MRPDRSFEQMQSRDTVVDAGLKAHMQRVYNRMMAGVLVTAITSFIVSTSPALLKLFLGGPQFYLVAFAPIVLIWFGFNPMTMPSSKLRLSFFGVSLLYGISLSVLALAFTGEDITRAFFIATGMFAGLSIFGYTTKKNLDGLRTFAVMGIIGVFIASIVNMFIFNEGLMDVIAGVGILAFAGLTAWQTQATKEMYHAAAGDEANSRMAWAAALNLYISFIALFQYILYFLGSRD
ncbi:MAG: Bax inhibitor-1/YccA family protein [Alphaproteobacteria bacterium]|jgi:hypothetical protein|nr:Bax inhibitor-1/YccA family protein [Alphaproteobacteria bacterium]MDP7221655.1 Bax inhibitor-1/YccA family protein [Alphaproteobacteria bacterium]